MRLVFVLLSLLVPVSVHAQVLETNDWENLTQQNWFYHTGHCGCGGTIDVTTDTPSGGGVFRATYLAKTHPTSVGGGIARYAGLTGRDIYVGHWVKVSSGFTWNPIGTKINYQWVAQNHTATGGVNSFTIRVQPGGNGFALDITIQGNGTVLKGLPHTYYNNMGSIQFQTGRWYWIETHTKLNDVIGTAPYDINEILPNGVVEVWIEDVLKAQRTDIRFVDKPDQTWHDFLHSPEWGGGGGTIQSSCADTDPGYPCPQYMYFDHTVISTSRIGRPGGAPVSDTTPPTQPRSFVATTRTKR